MTQTLTPDFIAATSKQISFAKALLAERGMDPVVAPTTTKAAASALIKTLLAMPKVAKPVVTAPEAPATPHFTAGGTIVAYATEKQVAFIAKLWEERYPAASGDKDMEALKAMWTALTKTQASTKIKELLAVPKPVAAKTTHKPSYAPMEATEYMKVASKGDVHVIDGEYYRIHTYQHSGKPYAAKAVIYSKASWAINPDGTETLLKAGRVKWVTAKGMIFSLSEETKASPAEAHAFGKMLGRCCFCSLQIDTPESVTAGFGPVCAKNKGLPWGATA